jgi:hypothetical protein
VEVVATSENDTVEAMTEASEPIRAKSSLASDRPVWKRCVDKVTGKPYYYNKLTNETSWTLPPDYVEEVNRKSTSVTSLQLDENRAANAAPLDSMPKEMSTLALSMSNAEPRPVPLSSSASATDVQGVRHRPFSPFPSRTEQDISENSHSVPLPAPSDSGRHLAKRSTSLLPSARTRGKYVSAAIQNEKLENSQSFSKQLETNSARHRE